MLVGGLLASFFLSRNALKDAEQAAQSRAEEYAATVLFNALTPELVAEPIFGADYRDLLITVQGGILSDDRVAQVRIWRPDGLLVFSSAQRDKQGEFVAQDDPQIEAALEGRTVSVPTETTVAAKTGLTGSDEKLYETFVPLQLLNQLGVSGVAQIDQRYSAIESAATEPWRTIQIGLLAALLVGIVLFVFSLRPKAQRAEAPVAAGTAEVRPARSAR